MKVSRMFPAFLAIHDATLKFEAKRFCPCRQTGKISEVVMPMIWFEEVSGECSGFDYNVSLYKACSHSCARLRQAWTLERSRCSPACQHCVSQYFRVCKVQNDLPIFLRLQMKTSVQIWWIVASQLEWCSRTKWSISGYAATPCEARSGRFLTIQTSNEQKKGISRIHSGEWDYFCKILFHFCKQ